MNMALADIHEAAFLETKGITPRFERRGDGRILFVYDADERFFRLQNEFHQDETLQLFVSTLKRLRGRMLDARDMNGRGHGEEFNGNKR